MNLIKSKLGALNTGIIKDSIIAIILVVILFNLYSSLVPEAQAAGDNLSSSGVPLGSLFSGSGILFLIIMVALIITIVTAFLPSKK